LNLLIGTLVHRTPLFKSTFYTIKRLTVNASSEEANKIVTFVRGDEKRQICLNIYPKLGLLLRVLREEFKDERLSYFLNPKTRKELDYNDLWELEEAEPTILVMEDGDNVNAIVYEFEKGDSFICRPMSKGANQ